MVKKSTAKSHSKHSKSTHISKNSHSIHKETYAEGLLNVDKDQDKYDKLFEQKLSEQYKEFRNFKEHSMQSKKFYGMIGVLIVIVLVAILLISFG